ncbi:MAG: Malate dehydrogenase (Oxaloacetate-decarboxylating), partial [Pseudonocardia sp.]|nr:Malate dehydrogenase (Oxaloacetate-decarboxylating) [Pseudonocardia sp.]
LAAAAVAAAATNHDDPNGARLPDRAHLADAADAVARAVARAAVEDGVAPKLTEEEVDEAIRASRWIPAYR